MTEDLAPISCSTIHSAISMKLALGSTVVFSILACSFLFHIGYQFAPLIELANAQALAQNDFDAGLANGDKVENLSRISLALRACSVPRSAESWQESVGSKMDRLGVLNLTSRKLMLTFRG